MAGGSRKMSVVLTVLVVLLTLVVGSWGVPKELCFCQCMHEQCMILPDATRLECGNQCDSACRAGGNPGRDDPLDFCGF